MSSKYEELSHHIGHKLTVANYGDGQEYSVECEDCHEVIYSEGKPNLSIDVRVLDDEQNIEVDFYFRKGDQTDSNFFYLLQREDNGILITNYGDDPERPQEWHIGLGEELSKVSLTILSKDVDIKLTARSLNLELEFEQEVNKLVKEHLT